MKVAISILILFLAFNAWGQNRNVASVIRAEIPYAANQIVWAEDDFVLFSGQQVGAARDAPQKGGVYRWYPRQGEVVQLLEHGTGVSVLCYDRGYVHIAFWRGEQRVIVQGPIGSETTISYHRTEKPPFQGVFNAYTCRFQPQPTPTASNRSVIEVLHDEHGFVEYEPPSPGSRRGKFFLVRPQNQSIVLPLYDVASRARYSAFRKAYVFQYGGGDLSDTAEKHTWLVEPDGQVTDYNLPKGPWLGGSIRTMPVQGGLVIASPAVKDDFRGLNVIRGNRVQRLIRGYVGAFATAPDGCLVSLSLSDGLGAKARARMLVVDTCKGGN
jgi:hypothetical protein